MKPQQLVIAAAVTLVAVFAGAAPAMGQISVVAHPEVTAVVTANDVSEIFTGAMRVWPSGAKIYVADQSDSEVGRSFYQTVLRRSTSVVRMHWIQLILSGQAVAPRRMTSDVAVIEFVRRTPGAIGYVRSTSLDGTVKELLRIDGASRKP
jgi:ABC-type phosphate transport system substrate-binding protein